MDGVMQYLDALPTLVRVVVSATLSYLWVVVLIRVSGKRTVAHLNSFDWIINVAVGALTASAILTPDDTVEAWVAIGTVIALQWLLTKLVQISPHVSRAIKEEPRILVRDGRMRRDVMADVRVNVDEVLASVRSAGLGSIEDVRVMILEADGSLSTIAVEERARSSGQELDVLRTVGRLYTSDAAGTAR